jgi:hypothetical protein
MMKTALIGGFDTILVVMIWIHLFPALAHADTLEQPVRG